MLPGTDTVQRKYVRVRQVLDVNIVADRSPIACGIVGSVDLNLGTFTRCYGEHNGNKVCFRAMIFSQPPAGSCNVEIAQTDRRQARRCDCKADHPVDCQLRSPIGIGRARNRALICP